MFVSRAAIYSKKIFPNRAVGKSLTLLSFVLAGAVASEGVAVGPSHAAHVPRRASPGSSYLTCGRCAVPMGTNEFGNTETTRLERHVFSVEHLFARKIALPVRFAEVKGEAAKLNCRRKTQLNAAGGHVAKRTGSAIYRSSKRAKHTTKKRP
jgi:hypothetical protein